MPEFIPEIRPLTPADRDRYIASQLTLFPDKPRRDVEVEVDALLATGLLHGTPGAVLLADEAGGRIVGFVEVALHPVAMGSAASPVAMVEGLFVVPDRRGQGLSGRLFDAASAWAAALGVREIASTCDLDNAASRKAHLAWGFEEAGRQVHFRRMVMSEAEMPAPAPSDPDWVSLQALPIDAGAVVRFVADARAGGIDLFLGTTRNDRNADAQPLLALDYEAYAEMALERMRKLAADARRQWPIVKLAMLHRVGRVGLSEPSVAIAVSTPHRGEAFAACRWLIDALKADVPIWKKEIWAQGEGTWVHR